MGAARPALIALALFCASCGGAGGVTAPAPATIGSNGCSVGPPEAGVHNPDRLTVLDPCRHAVGVAVDVAAEDDGDYHVWFTPDPGFESLMIAEDHFQGKPAMLAEIIPDCVGNPPDDQTAAKCPRSRLPIPRIGDHIAIAGPWVLDTSHNWNEIHPVDSITIVRE